MRVLVVDDEPAITDSLQRYLERKGHRVQVAHEAAEAIAAHRREPADVALIDLRIGTSSGMAVLHELQRHEAPPECLIMTGYGSIENAVEAMRSGAVDYIAKPFAFDDLDARLEKARAARAQRALRGGAPPPPAAPATLDEVERRHIAAVLERVGWHQGRAAEILRISPKTLYRKIRQYGFRRPRRGGTA